MKLRKVLYLALILLMVPAVSAFGTIEFTVLADAQAVNGTAADTTAAWPIQHGEYFSIQIIATGSPNLDITYQLSHNGTTIWSSEAGADATTTLIAGFTSTAWRTYSVSPMASLFIRFIVTGTGANAASGVRYSLVAQQWKKIVK